MTAPGGGGGAHMTARGQGQDGGGRGHHEFPFVTESRRSKSGES